MGDDYNWNNLPTQLLIAIVERLTCAEDYVRFITVSKSWKTATKEIENPCLPPRLPLLLLAEEVAPGGILAHHAFDDNDIDDEDTDDDDDGDSDSDVSDNDIDDIGSNEDNDDGNSDDDNHNDDSDTDSDYNENNIDNDDGEDDDDDDNNADNDDDEEKYLRDLRKYFGDLRSRYDHRNNSIGNSRGIYSLSTGKTYIIELPEAAGRVILGTNKGWLVTLGRDLQINLLHPLFKHQIPLPPMLTFPKQYKYDKYFTPEDRSDMFVHKVVLSSRVTTKNTDTSLADEYHDPIVMAIYGQCGLYLGFARLGDKVWTDVNNIPHGSIKDIAYHKGKFYIVNWRDVFVCYTDNDNKKGEFKVNKIASVPIQTFGSDNLIYLVETVSGSGLLLIVRTWRVKLYQPPHRMRSKYRTIDFSVWKLESNFCECHDIYTYTLKEENNLGNEAIFLGKNSSVSLSSSEIIRPNCIYFTDDKEDTSYRQGGGHDMGIFNMESRTIEPHFEGNSIHPISPPLWYI